MRDRRARQNTVAEIEYMRAPCETGQHALDAFIEAGASSNEGEWIKIALEREAGRKR